MLDEGENMNLIFQKTLNFCGKFWEGFLFQNTPNIPRTFVHTFLNILYLSNRPSTIEDTFLAGPNHSVAGFPGFIAYSCSAQYWLHPDDYKNGSHIEFLK